MITTVTTFIRLENTPETSRVIGWLTSQERLAYNQAVNVLNREPMMPKRARKGPEREARQLRSWVQSDLLSQTVAHLRKPGLPKAYKPRQT